MSQFLTTFFVLSLGGMFNAGYLLWKTSQKKKHPLVCPLNHDCGVVTESKWAKVFGIRNEILGFTFFITMFLAILGTVLIPAYEEFLMLFILIGASAAFLFSLFLVFLQAFVIKDYCFYCIISAIITTLLFLNSIALYS